MGPAPWKRDGGPLDGPNPQRAKIGESTESELGDQAFNGRHTFGFPDEDMVLTVTLEQLRRTGQEPNR